MYDSTNLQDNAQFPTCDRGSIVYSKDNGRTMQIIPLTCKRWKCPDCAKMLARQWKLRIASANPQRLITITVDPKRHDGPDDALEALLKAHSAFARKWREKGHTYEYCACIELQQNGYPHLHIFQSGDYVPQPYLSAFMDKAGVGKICDCRKIDNPNQAAAYVVKYLAKSAVQTSNRFPFNRLTRTSRGFYNTDEAETDQDPTTDHVVGYAPFTSHFVAEHLEHLGYVLDPNTAKCATKIYNWPHPDTPHPSIEELLYEMGIPFEHLHQFMKDPDSPSLNSSGESEPDPIDRNELADPSRSALSPEPSALYT